MSIRGYQRKTKPALWKQMEAEAGNESSPTRKTSRVRPLSLSRARLRGYYEKRKRVFLSENPKCEICGTTRKVGLHHQRGRNATLLIDERFWMSVCDFHHVTSPTSIHKTPRAAEKAGYLYPRGQFNVPPPDDETRRLRGIIMELTK
jgi:hypothetical protein